MKILIAFLITIPGFSQEIPFDKETGKYYFELTSETSLSTDSAYIKAKQFCIERNLDKDFIVVNENERLLDIGSFSVTFKSLGMHNILITYIIRFTIDIKFKEGKYKATITNMKASQNAQGTTPEIPIEDKFHNLSSISGGLAHRYGQKMNDRLKQAIYESGNKYLSDFKKSMSSTKSDW